MRQITSLITRLKNDSQAYPHLANLTFTVADNFSWNHTACAVSYAQHEPDVDAYLLHEYAHAVLNHKDFGYDIQLLELERAAWDTAASLAPNYGVSIDTDTAEDSLDTYRDWLHARSLCPNCESTGIQTEPRGYQCLACRQTWKVNEARTCGLKRYKKNNPA